MVFLGKYDYIDTFQWCVRSFHSCYQASHLLFHNYYAHSSSFGPLAVLVPHHLHSQYKMVVLVRTDSARGKARRLLGVRRPEEMHHNGERYSGSEDNRLRRSGSMRSLWCVGKSGA